MDEKIVKSVFLKKWKIMQKLRPDLISFLSFANLPAKTLDFLQSVFLKRKCSWLSKTYCLENPLNFIIFKRQGALKMLLNFPQNLQFIRGGDEERTILSSDKNQEYSWWWYPQIIVQIDFVASCVKWVWSHLLFFYVKWNVGKRNGLKISWGYWEELKFWWLLRRSLEFEWGLNGKGLKLLLGLQLRLGALSDGYNFT